MPLVPGRVRDAARRLKGHDRTDEMLLAMGGLESRLQRVATPRNLNDAEFKVFSQYGKDGVIQYLLSRIDVAAKTFIEIGVESYRE